MADIARMRFQSARRPEETGTIALSSDGSVRIEPSEAMIEKIAELEQEAVERSARITGAATFILIGLGLTAAVIGWLAGRIGGKLRDRIIYSHRIGRTRAEYIPDRRFRLELNNAPVGKTTFEWAPGEYDAVEAQRFIETYTQLREITEEEG